MKKTLLSLLGLILAAPAFAQKPDVPLVKVRYRFTHIRDTTQRDQPYTENMLLISGKNASVFTSYDAVQQAAELKRNLQEQAKNQAANGGMVRLNINKSGMKPTSSIEYFLFAKENKFYTKERVFNNYLIEEKTPEIDWKISPDTSNIAGISCQKASASFKGRNWTAWFAPDLPFQSGPWKLNGLPGLILAANDDKNEVQFQFEGMEKVEKKAGDTKEEKSQRSGAGAAQPLMGGNGSISIQGASPMQIANIGEGNDYSEEIRLPADAIKTSRKELDKLKETRDKDPQGFLKSQLGGANVDVKVVGGMPMGAATANGTKLPAKQVLNNPIELPEKP